MSRQIQGSQTDFSFGEIDVALKRADQHPARKAGLRQAANVRLLNSGGAQDRPGRTALFLESGRVEKVLMSPGNRFYLAFGNGYLRVYNAAGARVFASTLKGDGATAIPWTTATVKNISFVVSAGSQLPIYICYGDDAPLNVPQILTWDGVSQISTWTLSTYAETITAGGQKRTIFDRISPQNVTMAPSSNVGNIHITFSAPVLVSGMVGTRMTYIGRQILITAVTLSDFSTPTAGPSQYGTATVEEPLPQAQTLSCAVTASLVGIGDELTGATSAAKGILIAINTGSIVVQIIPGANGVYTFFDAAEVIVGPTYTLTSTSSSALSPQAVSIWDDEVMNLFRGYPTAVFYDQGRLGFNNFPALPSGIGWGAIGLSEDMYVSDLAVVSPDNAIFELAPGKSQVLFVVAGMNSSEFIFCDNAIYYIPISQTDPLVPGSVAFILLSGTGCLLNVKPQAAEQCILYVKAGGVTIGAVQAPGAYSRPYIVDDVSPYHSHLFVGSQPIAIAIPTASTQFSELYAYVLLANGSIVVGKYAIRSGLIEAGPDAVPKIGWLPWNGAGTVEWISAQSSSVVFTTSYAPNGIAAVSIVEALDNSQYLDGGFPVNAAPAAFAPPVGKGPLWWIAGGAVTLIDQVTRAMGTYLIDANGNIIPQFNGGENLAIASLMAGQPWTMTIEPFAPDAPSGQDIQQRMNLRQISRIAVYVINSTGFVFASLFSSKQTPTSPALGTIMQNRRVPAWNQGEDATMPPPLRETVEDWPPPGSSYDPRVAIIKDVPGPLLIPEIAMEITI